MLLLSGSGMFRTILFLVIIWQLLRIIMRMQQPPARPRGTHWSANDPRPKGDVRIERPEQRSPSNIPPDVEDADFEEIK